MRRFIAGTILFLGAVVAVQSGVLSMQNRSTDNRKNLQIGTPDGVNVALSALTAQRTDQILHLTGSVMIKTKDVIMQADEADYNERTADIALRGNVRVKLETYK